MREDNREKLPEILRTESLKSSQNSAIIYIESERDVTLLLLNKKHHRVVTYHEKEVPND